MDAEQITTLGLFQDCDISTRNGIAADSEEVEVGLGEVIAREGDFAYRFFGILEGLAAVTKGNTLLTILGKGDVFGEIGVLSGDRRTANVIAITPMKLAAMMSWDFKRLTEDHPDLAERLRVSMEERMAIG